MKMSFASGVCAEAWVNGSPPGTADHVESRLYLLVQSLLYRACCSTTLLQSCPGCQCESWIYCEAHCIVLAV